MTVEGTTLVQAYILFKVSSGSERTVCREIAEFNEVLVTGIIFGDYDIIAKVSVSDLQALEGFLAEKIRKVESILLTSTMIIAREYRGKTHRTTG